MPSGVVPGSMASICLSTILLPLFRDHVVEHAKDVGLLAEDFLIGIVGEEAAAGDSSTWRRCRCGRGRRGRDSGRQATESPRCFSRSAASFERAQILERGDAGFAAGCRRWESSPYGTQSMKLHQGSFVEQAVGMFVAGETSRGRRECPGRASRTGAGSGRYIQQS